MFTSVTVCHATQAIVAYACCILVSEYTLKSSTAKGVRAIDQQLELSRHCDETRKVRQEKRRQHQHRKNEVPCRHNFMMYAVSDIGNEKNAPTTPTTNRHHHHQPIELNALRVMSFILETAQLQYK